VIRRRRFLERTLDHLRETAEHVAYAEETAAGRGLLQRLDPRVKLCGLLLLVLATTMVHTVAGIVSVSVVALALAVASRLSLRRLAASVWLGALAVSGVIALPACVLTPGRAVAHVPWLHWPVTAQGLTSATYLVLRVETSATLGALLVLTTPWPHVLKAMRSLRVPALVVVMLAMTYRYVLLLLETAHDMFESRKSRLVGHMDGADARRLSVATAGVLLGRTMQMGDDVYLAMRARGFAGDVQVLDDFQMRRRDWAAALAIGAVAMTAIWLGR
jgi:cobalt ECF transporter T component CbiQ